MSQAQILNQKDYKRLLAATKMTRHADRNRLAVVLSFGAGLRAKEIASVTVDNVIDASGRVKSDEGNRVIHVQERVDAKRTSRCSASFSEARSIHITIDAELV